MSTRKTTAKTVRQPSLAKASAKLGKALAPKTAKSALGKKSGIDANKPTGAIIVHKAAESGNAILVQAANGHSFTRPIYGDTAEFRKIAAVGQPYDAARTWNNANPPVKPHAQLARGVEARQAPQSAKAVADQKTTELKASKSSKKTSAPKAAKNKAPSAGSNKPYKLGKTKNTAKPDSWRYHMLSTIQSAKDTDSAKAAHAKSKKFSANKLDFNWAAAQGYIIFTK
jgi:hypothetical protein